MATVYSLVCWGGRTGKTVTLTDAGDIVNSSAHGLRDGTPLQFTSGTMPNGLALNTTYYAKRVSADTFTLYTTAGLTTQVTWTGAGAGPFVLKSKAAIDYLASPPTYERWGTAGAERCYDGLVSWQAGRSAALMVNEEVCEIGEAFTENCVASNGLVSIPAGAIRIETKVNGIRSSAFHYGRLPSSAAVLADGYILACNSGAGGGSAISMIKANTTIDGISIMDTAVGYYIELIGTKGTVTNCIAKNNILRGKAYTSGIGVYGQGSRYENNLIIECGQSGIYVNSYGYGAVVANNVVTKCGIGFNAGSGNDYGSYYNNISLGNTINWQAYSVTGFVASNNVGLAGSAWMNGAGTSRIEIDVNWNSSIPLFMDYANNDFRPYSSGSPDYTLNANSALIVDAGIEYYGILPYDIADDERPNYNNGGAEAVDVGCYEFDHGYGPHPASTTVTFVGVNAGSEIRVFNSSGVELAGIESSTADPVLSWVLPIGDVTIKVVAEAYVLIEFPYSSIAGAVALPIQQALDRWYSNP